MGEQMFIGFCNGASYRDLGTKYGFDHAHVYKYGKSADWDTRKETIIAELRFETQAQLTTLKKNAIRAGTLVEGLNVKKIIKEVQRLHRTGVVPSFVGTNPQEYEQGIKLGRLLRGEDVQKIDINATIDAQFKSLTPQQVDKLLDYVCERKQIPIRESDKSASN